MKKTILIFAGVALLASCAKEVALDVYEDAPAAKGELTIVAQKGENGDTKVTYNGTKATWSGYEKLGIFTYYPGVPDEEEEGEFDEEPEWENANVAFKTTNLFAGKRVASFFGMLGTVNEGSTIYGVYPWAVAEKGINGPDIIDSDEGSKLATFTYQEANYDDDLADVGEGETPVLKSETEESNYVMLYKSTETFGFNPEDMDDEDEDRDLTSLPTLTGKTMTAKLNFAITAAEYAKLKSLTLVAYEADGETVVPFHTTMTLDLLKFDTYADMTSSNYDPEDLYGEEEGEANMMVFNINDYELEEAGESVILPVLLFPTDKFVTLKYVVEWADVNGVKQYAEKKLTNGKEIALAPNMAIDLNVELGKTDAYVITSVPARTDDPTHPWTLRTWIADRIEYGFTHIIVKERVNNVPTNLALEDLETASTWGAVETTAGLIIPGTDKNGNAITKNIIIEAPIKNGAAVTPLVSDDYAGTIKFVNTTSVADGTYDFVVNSANASFILESDAENEGTDDAAYNKITLKAAKYVTLNASTGSLVEGNKAAIETLTLTEDAVVAGSVSLQGTKNVSIFGTFDDNNNDTDEYVFVTNAEKVNISATGAEYVHIGEVTEEVNVIGTGDTQNVTVGHILDENGDPVPGVIAAEVNLAGTFDKAYVYTTTALTVEEGATIGTLYIIDKDAEEETIPSVSSVTIKGVVNSEVVVPASATFVNIAEDGSVKSLTLNDGVQKVEIDGTVRGDAVADVDTKTASEVRIGKTADIYGGLISTPNVKGVSVTIEGEKVNNAWAVATIYGNVIVRNMDTFTSKGHVRGNYSLEEIANKTEVVLPNSDNEIAANQTLRFFDCNNEINLTSMRETAPQLVFTACTGSNITIDGYKGEKINLGSESTRLAANVTFKNCTPTTSMTVYAKNITLENGEYSVPVTLNASKDIVIGGTFDEEEEENTPLEFTGEGAVSLTAENVTVGYVTSAAARTASVLASGNVTVGATDFELNLSNLNFSFLDRAAGDTPTDATKVVEPTSITFTKSTIGTVTSFWDVLFNKCVISDGKLEYKWFTTGAGTAAVKNANGAILFTLDHCKKGNVSVGSSDLLDFISNDTADLNTNSQKGLLKIRVVNDNKDKTYAYTDLEQVSIQDNDD